MSRKAKPFIPPARHKHMSVWQQSIKFNLTNAPDPDFDSNDPVEFSTEIHPPDIRQDEIVTEPEEPVPLYAHAQGAPPKLDSPLPIGVVTKAGLRDKSTETKKQKLPSKSERHRRSKFTRLAMTEVPSPPVVASMPSPISLQESSYPFSASIMGSSSFERAMELKEQIDKETGGGSPPILPNSNREEQHPLPYASPDLHPPEQLSQTSIFTDKLVAELLRPIPAISKLPELSPTLECTGPVGSGKEKFDDCCLDIDCINCFAKIQAAFIKMSTGERTALISRIVDAHNIVESGRQFLRTKITADSERESIRARIFASAILAIPDRNVVRNICRSLKWN